MKQNNKAMSRVLSLLDEQKSMRQIEKENAEQAREDGNDDLVDVRERETELYASLGADVTQNEGS